MTSICFHSKSMWFKTQSNPQGQINCIITTDVCNWTSHIDVITHYEILWKSIPWEIFSMCTLAGILDSVLIDTETQENGVTKCTTSEAWSTFSWHHPIAFWCQWHRFYHFKTWWNKPSLLIPRCYEIIAMFVPCASCQICKLWVAYAPGMTGTFPCHPR